MEALEAIMTRHCVRSFSDREVTDETIATLLKAAMAAPSSTNARDWSFIVVRDSETLNKMADANGRPANPLRKAPVGILVCGDTERSYKVAPEYWIIDCANACENLLLAAHAMGLGGVWLGTWPEMERVEGQKKLFDLPDTVIPHSVLAIGWPSREEFTDSDRPKAPPKPPEDPAERIHYEKW